MIETILKILAVVLVGAAAYLLWSGNKDYGFVVLVVGCCSYFLSIRFQLKARMREREKNESADAREASPVQDDA